MEFSDPIGPTYHYEEQTNTTLGKVITLKSRDGVSLVEQDTIEYEVKLIIKFLRKKNKFFLLSFYATF